MRRRKPQQISNLFAIGKVFGGAFFDDCTEGIPELVVVLWLFTGHFGQHIENAFRQSTANRLDLLVLLQNFTRHIQRQITGVQHALYESQVHGKELLRPIHDEGALHIQLEPPGPLTMP